MLLVTGAHQCTSVARSQLISSLHLQIPWQWWQFFNQFLTNSFTIWSGLLKEWDANAMTRLSCCWTGVVIYIINSGSGEHWKGWLHAPCETVHRHYFPSVLKDEEHGHRRCSYQGGKPVYQYPFACVSMQCQSYVMGTGVGWAVLCLTATDWVVSCLHLSLMLLNFNSWAMERAAVLSLHSGPWYWDP